MEEDSGEEEKAPKTITISYKELGTVSIDEMIHALIEDMKALQGIYNVQYLKGSTLTVRPTNEYGEDIRVRRPTGGPISDIDTHHYRPACKDYEL